MDRMYECMNECVEICVNEINGFNLPCLCLELFHSLYRVLGCFAREVGFRSVGLIFGSNAA